jgi:hypothetical protein
VFRAFRARTPHAQEGRNRQLVVGQLAASLQATVQRAVGGFYRGVHCCIVADLTSGAAMFD